MMHSYCNISAMRRQSPISVDCTTKLVDKTGPPLSSCYQTAKYLRTFDIGRSHTYMKLVFRASSLTNADQGSSLSLTKCAQIPLLSRNAHDNEIMRLRIYDAYNFFLGD